MSGSAGSNTSERAHLSIREVLDLLVADFPEVTISKIRFLESRGLIHPERTPSGYRKFFDADVERLRWILQQQREHFLPLKVIKGRLEQSGTPAPVAPRLFGTDDEFLGAKPPNEIDRSVRAREPGLFVSERNVSPAHPVSGYGLRAHVEHVEEPKAAVGAPTDQAVESAKSTEPAATPSVPEPGPVPSAAEMLASSPARRKPRRTATAVSGVSMSAAELATAVGVEPEAIAELVDYGLIACRDVAGESCFDENALVVARLASGFSRFGIEARHLRVFLHAAEREAGLYSQVVTPLLRQRNPASRDRALHDLDDLTKLGQELRDAFIAASLAT